MRPAFGLRAALAFISICLTAGDSGKIEVDRSESKPAERLRACTVQELLPLACQNKSSEWSDDHAAESVYDCTCAAMKGRYFCPSQENSKHSEWKPQAVSQGVCRSQTRSDMVWATLPPDAKILLYGNSHMRQVMEGIMCMFESGLLAKTVSLGSSMVETTVSKDMQCRGCRSAGNADRISPVQETLLDHQCIGPGDDCICDDSQGEYMFDNGAVVHYTFSNLEDTKGLAFARKNHGMEPLSSYDAVFMNPGNPPSLGPQKAVEMVLEVQAAGTQAFWLSMYDGNGRVSNWSKDQRARFFESGAKYVDIECMARGMKSWTKGAVEGVSDGHFCMPGPSDEIGLLLLKIIWALFEERK